MKLSIVVLSYQTRNLLKYFLTGVLDFKLPWAWEIVVVDNHSGDGTAQMVKKEFPVVKFISSPKNLGMGGGNNLGITNSRGEYVLVANPDVTLNERSLVELMAFLDHQPAAGLVGPKIVNPDGTRQDTCYRWPKFSTFLYRRTFLANSLNGQKHLDDFLYRGREFLEPTPVDWVLGGCFLARRSALMKTGLFDQRFFLFLEDTDLCRRMWQSRFSVWYYPGTPVVHLPHRLSAGHRSLKDLFSRVTWIHIVSWFKYFWKWRGHK